jgi:hypothetical protein
MCGDNQKDDKPDIIISITMMACGETASEALSRAGIF